MFGNWKEKYFNAVAAYNLLAADFERLQLERHNNCRLANITRNGRLNTFHFVRNGQSFTIETMGLLSDDVEGWKKQAGI